jgi:hypothetical protein
MKGKDIVVWFSSGAASAVAAIKTIEKYGKNNNVRIVNNPIKEEDADNQRFLRDVASYLGIEIESAVNSDYPDTSCVKVWEKRRFMSGVYGAPCTLELKKNARREYEKHNNIDFHVLGFTLEEKNRHDRFVLTERENVIPVLIDEGITKSDCYSFLRSINIELPKIYSMGYPNANCIGCVKATSPTYWNHVRKMHPDVFDQRARQSEEIGAKLVRVKGKRILLKDLDENAIGKPMKNMDFECGIFCEERS